MKKHLNIIITGAVLGLFAVILVVLGNPKNMGICVACFIRDTAGSLKLHSAQTTMAIRPEIIGIILGAFLIAIVKKEFKPKGGSSPFTRFILAIIVMVGALMFLGCPLRMVLRLSGGDLNAIFGLIGFIPGVLVGALALKKGFSLKRTYTQNIVEGTALPIASAVLLVLAITVPSIFAWSTSGPGASLAPIGIAFALTFVVGILAQRTRLCMAGGIRDIFLFKDFHLLFGTLAIFVVALIANIITGNFNLGFVNQPIAHTDELWNFLGMFVVGWGSVLLGGCPMRQLVLAGEGNSDAAITIIGFLFGASICHNFSLASSTSGATQNGKIATIIVIALLLVITIVNIVLKKGGQKNEHSRCKRI